MNRLFASAIFALVTMGSGLAWADQSVPAPAAQVSEAGVSYVIGGIGDDERKAMRSAYHHYKLRVEVAEEGGAYSANMQLKLLDMQNRLLLDVLVDAPWLLVDVPSGEYQIQVAKNGGGISQTIKLGTEAQQHVIFLWPPK